MQFFDNSSSVVRENLELPTSGEIVDVNLQNISFREKYFDSEAERRVSDSELDLIRIKFPDIYLEPIPRGAEINIENEDEQLNRFYQNLEMYRKFEDPNCEVGFTRMDTYRIGGSPVIEKVEGSYDSDEIWRDLLKIDEYIL
ncbi:hypothetical protein GLU60_02735 [Nanohaloarchaea archaeon H01]|nr:hypothetical protein [Nanohaloarchaea archaeon H01]